MKYYTITDPAYEVLCQEFKTHQIKVVSYREVLGHDGYDEYGPQSDLWDFYVVTIENGEHIYYNYHWENWYDDEPHEYILYHKTPVSKLTGYHLEVAQTMLS